MLETVPRPVAVSVADASDETAERYLAAFRWMLLARTMEDKLASLYRAGKIYGGVFVGRGQEALSAALGVALRARDIFAPLIRDQAGRLAFGESLLACAQTYLGSRLGPMRGRDGNVHRGDLRRGHFAMISHLGAMISVVAGALLARKARGETGIVGATCIGDGGTSTGAWHEALNMAAVEKLPLVVVVANNLYAYSTPNDRQFACTDLADRALGYGLEGHTVDACDLGACLEVVGGAVEKARAGEGPQLVVATLLRLAGHGEHDDAHYVTDTHKAAARDCLRTSEEFIAQRGWLSAEKLDRLRADAQRQVDEAIATAQREPAPDPDEETWCALATARLSEGFA